MSKMPQDLTYFHVYQNNTSINTEVIVLHSNTNYMKWQQRGGRKYK